MSEKDSLGSVPTNRRQFLHGVGTAGTTLGVLAGTATARRDMTEIPMAKRLNEVIWWERVPTKWLRQARRVERRVDAMAEKLESNPAVRKLAVTDADYEIGGKQAKAVSVVLDDTRGRERINRLADDVPTKVRVQADERTSTSNVTTAGTYYRGDSNPVIGGYELGVDSFGPTGSATTVVEYGGSKRVLTAGHITSTEPGSCVEPVDDITMYQNDDVLGAVSKTWRDLDTALIDFSGGTRSAPVSPQVADSTGTVTGYLTREALANSGSFDVETRGIVTGPQTTTLKSYNSYNKGCGSWTYSEFIETNATFGQGDSGGPVFTNNRDTVVMVGTIHNNDQGADDGVAIPSYKQSRKNITFAW
jgi:S1-C subfamily serine protease